MRTVIVKSVKMRLDSRPGTYLRSERDGLSLVGITESVPSLFRTLELGDLNRIHSKDEIPSCKGMTSQSSSLSGSLRTFGLR